MTRICLASKSDLFSEGLIGILANAGYQNVLMCESPPLTESCVCHADVFDVILISAKRLQYPLADFFQQFLRVNPNTKLLVFGHDDSIHFIHNTVRAGAHGFINDEVCEADLVNAINGVLRGALWVPREVMDKIALEAFELERLLERTALERVALLIKELTGREKDIFRLVLEGISTRDIAEALHLSEQSVKLYLGRLFRKFDVKNRSQLILMAFDRVSPVQNLIGLLRHSLDRRRLATGEQANRRTGEQANRRTGDYR